MSQRQLPLRVAAMLAATAGALAPMADALARRRRRRHNAEDDDDDTDDLIRRRLRRRRRDDDGDDDDDRITSLARARQRKRARQEADEDNDDGAAETAAAASPRQSIREDLGIDEIVQERLDNALFGGGGGGGDEPNIEVSQDGDLLVVVTKDIEFAADSEGMEVETGGISYTSGAGGGVLEDFES